MNAADQVQSLASVKALADALRVVRNYYPETSVNLNPWIDNPETRIWSDKETLDMAFHFPGWTPKLECRSLLMQLRVSHNGNENLPKLLGVLLRGMTFAGESWRLVTIGDWQLTGLHLPQPSQRAQLQQICRDLFAIFHSSSAKDFA